MNHQHQQHTDSKPARRGKWVLACFLLIAAYFLWTEHRAHVASVLPYLLLLACPLLHLFHHGHGHHGQSQLAVKQDDQGAKP